MSNLRALTQQALEQLEINRTNFRKGPSKSICKMLAGGNDEIITALRDALENEFNPDWDQVEALQESLREHMAEINRLRAALAQEQAERVDEYRKGFIAGQIEMRDREQAEPVQEPYCYVYEYDSPHGLHREFYPREYNGMKPTRTVQVYLAPPQMKPLTEEEIIDLWEGVSDPESPEISMIDFARAIERAHGING